MTLTEWTDIIARMDPAEREAMGYAMHAAAIQAKASEYMPEGEALERALAEAIGPALVARFYPGHTAREG